MFILSPSQCLLGSATIFGIGFTLMKYSRDGDSENRLKRGKTIFADAEKTSAEEAWDELRNLATYPLVEVTWNVFMFIAIVSTLAFLGLAGKLVNLHSENVSVGATSLLFLLIVFSLQDLVHKWRNAHRRHPLLKDMIDIMERLKKDKHTK
jgi:hypothetical protein